MNKNSWFNNVRVFGFSLINKLVINVMDKIWDRKSFKGGDENRQKSIAKKQQ